jgi:putative transposase
MLAARGIVVSHKTMRQWASKCGQQCANEMGRRLPCAGDKWTLDDGVITIAAVSTRSGLSSIRP